MTDPNPVLELNTAYLDGLEELRDWATVRLRFESSPRRRILTGNEVWNVGSGCVEERRHDYR